MKTVKIRFLPSEGIQYDNKDSTVVIIDVLRATTTIVTLLFKGAKKVIATNDIQFALDFDGLKIGEKNSLKINGFDYNNSPTLLFEKDFNDKDVVITTSNGTKAVDIYKEFKNVISLSFVNFSAVKKYLQNKQDVILVCSGSHGEFSLEDFVCASLMAQSLDHEVVSDAVLLSNYLSVNFDNYKKICKLSMHAKHLIDKGFERDVDFSLQKDLINIVPVYKDFAFIKEVL